MFEQLLAAGKLHAVTDRGQVARFDDPTDSRGFRDDLGWRGRDREIDVIVAADQ